MSRPSCRWPFGGEALGDRVVERQGRGVTISPARAPGAPWRGVLLLAGRGRVRCPAAMRRPPRPSRTGWTAITWPPRAVLEDADLRSRAVHLDHAPAHGVRHAIEIAVERDHAIAGDPPLQLQHRLEWAVVRHADGTRAPRQNKTLNSLDKRRSLQGPGRRRSGPRPERNSSWIIKALRAVGGGGPLRCLFTGSRPKTPCRSLQTPPLIPAGAGSNMGQFSVENPGHPG